MIETPLLLEVRQLRQMVEELRGKVGDKTLIRGGGGGGSAPAAVAVACACVALTPITASGPQTIDTYAVLAGDLVCRAGDGAQNGIWTVNLTGAWTLKYKFGGTGLKVGSMLGIGNGANTSTGGKATIFIVTGNDAVEGGHAYYA